LELYPIEVRGPAEFDRAFAEWADKKIQGLVVHDHGQFTTNADVIAALAAKHQLASIGPLELSTAGGLLGYGVDFPDTFRRAAEYVGKILKGAKAADLPIEQAREFRYVLNLKTAKALGMSVPQSVLLRADEVIQ
jgi:putative ABC transport system substrate-binding protein